MGGALPIPLMAEHGPPPRGRPFVDYAVHMAYVAHGSDATSFLPSNRKARGKTKGKGKPTGCLVSQVGAACDREDMLDGGIGLQYPITCSTTPAEGIDTLSNGFNDDLGNGLLPEGGYDIRESGLAVRDGLTQSENELCIRD